MEIYYLPVLEIVTNLSLRQVLLLDVVKMCVLVQFKDIIIILVSVDLNF